MAAAPASAPAPGFGCLRSAMALAAQAHGPWRRRGTTGTQGGRGCGVERTSAPGARSASAPRRAAAGAWQRPRRRDARPSVGRHLQAVGDTVQRPPALARRGGAPHWARAGDRVAQEWRGTSERSQARRSHRSPRECSANTQDGTRSLTPDPEPHQLSDKTASVGPCRDTEGRALRLKEASAKAGRPWRPGGAEPRRLKG